jgi:hypothetical protein
MSSWIFSKGIVQGSEVQGFNVQGSEVQRFRVQRSRFSTAVGRRGGQFDKEGDFGLAESNMRG